VARSTLDDAGRLSTSPEHAAVLDSRAAEHGGDRGELRAYTQT